MSKSYELPPLPEPSELWLPTHVHRYYPPDEMEPLFRAYGKACYAAAMEEAAKVCDTRWPSEAYDPEKSIEERAFSPSAPPLFAQ